MFLKLSDALVDSGFEINEYCAVSPSGNTAILISDNYTNLDVQNVETAHISYRDEHPRINVVYTPELAYYDATRWVISEPRTVKVNKRFCCLVNRVSEYRYKMFKEVLKYQSISYLSYRNSTIRTPEYHAQFVLDQPFSNFNEDTLSDREIMRYEQWNYPVDDFLIDVNCETYMYEKSIITEKSLKPLYGLKIPLILGYKGHIAHLREHGYDMFDDIIDTTYDEIPDVDDRYLAFAEQIHRLANMEIDLDDIVPRLQKNRDLFLSYIDKVPSAIDKILREINV